MIKTFLIYSVIDLCLDAIERTVLNNMVQPDLLIFDFYETDMGDHPGDIVCRGVLYRKCSMIGVHDDRSMNFHGLDSDGKNVYFRITSDDSTLPDVDDDEPDEEEDDENEVDFLPPE